MNKFNAGDTVVVIGNSYSHCFEMGQICIVAEATYGLDEDDVEVAGTNSLDESGESVQQIMHNTDIELVE